MTNLDTVPVTGCSPHFVSWRPRFCVQPTCLAGSGVKSSRACYRIQTRQDALLLAERLRAAFEATTHTFADAPLSATASVGVAISDDASSDLAALLDVADQALYRAKAIGPQSCRAFDAFGRTAVDAVARRSFRNGEWRLIWSSTVQGGGKRRGARSEYLAQLGSALFQDDRCGREREPVCTVSPACLDGS